MSESEREPCEGLLRCSETGQAGARGEVGREVTAGRRLRDHIDSF